MQLLKIARRAWSHSGLAFLLVVPALAHLLFSSLGFSPTDDGFILAASRRILEGEVPHRDFISIRPPASYLLHLPLVALGGEYVFWLSRYTVWLEFAVIAWAWTLVVERLTEKPFAPFQRMTYALVAFILSAHTWPIQAWHSIDALLVTSLGVLLVTHGSRRTGPLGFGLLGLAPLFRQNFLLIPPAFIVLLGRWRQPWAWAAAAIPTAFYAAALAGAGALPDAVLQLRSHTDFVTPGLKRYVIEWAIPWGILAGLGLTHLQFLRLGGAKSDSSRPLAALADGMVYGVCFVAVVSIGQTRFSALVFEFHPAFALFGMVAGATIYMLFTGRGHRGASRAGLLAVLTAWSVSISVGNNTLALATGPLALVLLGYAHALRPDPGRGGASWGRGIVFASLLSVALVSFWVGRTSRIYCDRPARELVYPLDGVFPGAKMIRTNQNTFAFLQDLQQAVEEVGGRPYIIVQELAAYWVRASQRNLLPIDWPQGTELAEPAVFQRVIESLENQRGNAVVILQKVAACDVPFGFRPLPQEGHYWAVSTYVRQHFIQIGETRWFSLYE